MKEITKVAGIFLVGVQAIFLFSIKDGSQGHVVVTFSDTSDKVLTPHGALKVKRGSKEDGRVATFTTVWVKALLVAVIWHQRI